MLSILTSSNCSRRETIFEGVVEAHEGHEKGVAVMLFVRRDVSSKLIERLACLRHSGIRTFRATRRRSLVLPSPSSSRLPARDDFKRTFQRPRPTVEYM